MLNTNLATAYEPEFHAEQQALEGVKYSALQSVRDHTPVPTDEGEALVRRIYAGDTHAEHMLVKQYQPQIERIGRQLGADAILCEDLAQEVMLKVILSLRGNGLKDVAKLSAYVNQTTRFTYYQWQRNKNSQLEFKESCDDAKHSSNVEQECLRASNRKWVIRQIKKLKMARDRQLLLRFYFDHQDKCEVCVEMDLSHAQFDKLLWRARERLKEVVHG